MNTTTVKCEDYFGYEINVYKTDELFGYVILSVNAFRIASEQGFSTAEEALEIAKEKLDDGLGEQYDIELTANGEQELKEFLEENFKNFDPDRLWVFVEKLTDDKRDAGVGSVGALEIDSYYSKTGRPVIFDAGDEYFQVAHK